MPLISAEKEISKSLSESLSASNDKTHGHEKSDVYCRSNSIELDHMAGMLSRLGGSGYCVRENSGPYDSVEIDPDPDSDFDRDETKRQHPISDQHGS